MKLSLDHVAAILFFLAIILTNVSMAAANIVGVAFFVTLVLYFKYPPER